MFSAEEFLLRWRTFSGPEKKKNTYMNTEDKNPTTDCMSYIKVVKNSH